jgi:urate oxidase
LAQRTRTESIEDFGKELVNFLLERHSQIASVHVDVEKAAWSNVVSTNNIRHPTAFIQSSNEVQLTTIKRSRHGAFSILSGLKDLKLMKTSHSSFAHFYRDSLTTLADATDRLFGTAIQATWTYDDQTVIDYDKTREHIRELIIDIFADHHSASVQHTLHAIGKYIVEHVPTITKIDLKMPNIHCIPVDLTRFGEENKNEIFMPINDPHGFIHCEIKRSTKTSPISKL